MAPRTKTTSQIDIRPLKTLVIKLPDSALRDLILSDSDSLTLREFILKTEVWMKLLRRIHF